MLDYEWGNPSASIMVTSDSIPDLSKPAFHPYGFNPEAHFAGGAVPMNQNPNYQMISATFPDYYHHLHNHVYYKSGPISYFSQALPLDPASQGPGQFVMAAPKIEPGGGYEFNSRIGLNLGGRTYFASAEDEFSSRGYLRSRGIEPGSVNCPRCQVEGCGTDLSHAKHYHRRHKVCEFHSKAATVVAAGLTQRFCQQCSRFHLLSEFDNGKRSCRRRLADHNRRRRKSNQSNNSNQDNNVKPQSITKNNSPRHPEILQRPMPPHSRAAQMTVANSPPRIGLDGTSSYSSGGAATSAASRSSLFY